MKLLDLINAKKEKERRQKKIDTAKKMVFGSAIGAIAGMLFAPKSGKETREDIVNKTKEAAESAKNTVKDSIGAIKEMEEKVKERVQDFKDRDMFEIDLEDKEEDEPIEEEE